MIRPRDSLPSLAPAPSRDFPALRRVLPFTLPYRLRMAGAMLALLVASATVLDALAEGFEAGDYRAAPIVGTYPLAEAVTAYQLVAAGAPGRIVLHPQRGEPS